MINWFPGHMAKARREIEDNLKLVDIVFELLDARIPLSSRNPMLDEILQNKKRLILLTKSNLADPLYTKMFIDYFKEQGVIALEVDAISGLNINKIMSSTKFVLKDKLESDMKKGLKQRPIRAMIVGIPNVGKSTLINRLVNKRVTKVGDRPGITKARQWIRIGKDLDLLDTPGVLWPKFEDRIVGYNLALTGAIKDQVLNLEDIGNYLLDFLKNHYSGYLRSRYDINIEFSNSEIISEIASSRGIFGSDLVVRVVDVLLHDFRLARIGRITLDRL